MEREELSQQVSREASRRDFDRLGLDSKHWRISDVNAGFE